MKNIEKSLPNLIVISLLSLVIYGAGQQILRQEANDPQIRMSEEISRSLAAGNDIGSLVPSHDIDLSYSIYPFVMIFDANGKLLSSTATLNGEYLHIPQGVLDFTKNSSRSGYEDRVTWQPAKGVREAITVNYFSGPNSSGFVVAGRSLRDTEERENLLFSQVFLGWLATILMYVSFQFFLNKK